MGNAETGEDAYKMILNSEPDIVLLDVVMPGMDGVEVMEKVKTEGDFKKKPSFIMVSAAGSENVTEDSFRMGANYFIMKPFEKDSVIEKIRRVASYRAKPRMEDPEDPRKVKPYGDLEEYRGRNLEKDVTLDPPRDRGACPYQRVSVFKGCHHRFCGGSGHAVICDQGSLPKHRQEAPDHAQPGGAGYPPRD